VAAMRDGLSSLDVPLSSTDPGATIDEMRARLGKSSSSLSDAQQKALEADRRLEEARSQASVEDMLARYKQGISPVSPPAATQSNPPQKQNQTESQKEDEQPPSEKTLGPTSTPPNPIHSPAHRSP